MLKYQAYDLVCARQMLLSLNHIAALRSFRNSQRYREVYGVVVSSVVINRWSVLVHSLDTLLPHKDYV